MISELHGKTPRKGSSHKKVNSSLQKKVVDSLVFKYLCENGFDYSAGVFLPEVEMSQREVSSVTRHAHQNSNVCQSHSNAVCFICLLFIYLYDGYL